MELKKERGNLGLGGGYGDQRTSGVETEETWLLEDPLDHVDRHVTAIVGVAVFVLMLALFKQQIKDLI